MIWTETSIPGVMRVDLDRREDDRGFFARSFCVDDFRENGLDMEIVQMSISYNRLRGTLRGIHFQMPPHEEVKVVRCTRGAVYDVVADLRPGSPTHTAWLAVQLDQSNRTALYLPHGVAHGFLTLTDDAEVHYAMGSRYVPEASGGVRWNDPAMGIRWPFEPVVVSARDRSFADYQP